jgi:hypothetical protein
MNNSVVVPTATTATATTAVTNLITVNPRREELKALSNSLKQLADENQTSINAALVFFYSEQTGVSAQDFKTLEPLNHGIQWVTWSRKARNRILFGVS